MDPTYPFVPVLAWITCFLFLIPLVTRLNGRLWNTGICTLTIWLLLEEFSLAVGSIVWKNNTNDVAPVFCDIMVFIQTGAAFAKRSCAFAITHRLYKIISSLELSRSAKQKRSALIFDLTLCVGLPSLEMALMYTHTTNRYQIDEEFGCLSALAPIGFTILISSVWLVLLPVISAFYYCPRICWFFYSRRREVNEFFSNSTDVKRDNYFRLLAVACLDLLVTLPISIINFVIIAQISAATPGFEFWPGWEAVHQNWDQIIHVPADGPDGWKVYFWNVFGQRYNEFSNTPPAIAYFVLFGLTREARAAYVHAFWRVARLVGLHPPPPKSRPSSVEATIVFDSGRTDQGHWAYTDSVQSSPDKLGSSFASAIDPLTRAEKGEFGHPASKMDDGVQQTVVLEIETGTPLSSYQSGLHQA